MKVPQGVFRRLRSPFWWIRYSKNGKQQRESSSSEKWKDAHDLLLARLREIEAMAAPQPRVVGAASSMQELYESLERDYLINQKKSIRNVRMAWSCHLEPHFGALSADAVDAKAIELYIAKRQEAGVANGTINRELAALKRMFKLAVRAGRMKLGDQPYIPALKERNVRKGFLKDAEYDALARETAKAGLWLRAMFELGYTYGWRKSELLNLRVGQLDLGERTITLDPGTTKSDEGRLVTMTDNVFELLRECVRGKAHEELVFTRERSKLADGRIADFRKAWARATEAAGCPGLLFHDLRRTGVRNLVRAGVPEKLAMTISGHKTRAVFERYNIVDQGQVQEAVRKLEASSKRRRERKLLEEQLLELPFDEAADAPEGNRKPAEGISSEAAKRKLN